MKKNSAAQTQPAQTPAKKTLFGLSADQLKAVYGGGGVIVQQPEK